MVNIPVLNWIIESVVSYHINIIIHDLQNLHVSSYIYIIIYMLHKILK